MSRENLQQFMNQVAESEELQARIGEEIDTESLVVLGAECGCEFTAKELQELSRHGGVAWRNWRAFPLPTKGLSFWRLATGIERFQSLEASHNISKIHYITFPLK